MYSMYSANCTSFNLFFSSSFLSMPVDIYACAIFWIPFATWPSLARLLLCCVIGFDKSFWSFTRKRNITILFKALQQNLIYFSVFRKITNLQQTSRCQLKTHLESQRYSWWFRKFLISYQDCEVWGSQNHLHECWSVECWLKREVLINRT